jgi:hypothetical protein
MLVNPSRYDEAGLMVFRYGIGHNGSLALLSGIIEDHNRRHRGVSEIRYEIFDEHVTNAVTPERLRAWRDAAAREGSRFLLMLCGVQTNSYPRGRDIALMARREGIDVVAGGIHLSCHGPSLDFLVSCGVSVGIGECEPFFDDIIADALGGTLKPVYRMRPDEGLRVKTSVTDIQAPALDKLPFPHAPRSYLRRFLSSRQMSIDSSRGCPYICTFCTVKNAFGRTVRSRDPEELAAWIAEQYDRHGIHTFGFTDDNFVRSPRHLEVLAAIARVRQGGRRAFKLSVLVDVEATCFAEEPSKRGEKSRHFLKLCRDAGVGKICLGLESTNDASLKEVRKHVNRARGTSSTDAHREVVARYRAAVRSWQAHGVRVECSIILGMEGDDRDTGLQTAKDMIEIGADLVNFTLITPLPGAEDYAWALESGKLLDTDFNEFFYKPLLRHPRLSPDELTAIYSDAVSHYYSVTHMVRRTLRGLFGLGRPRTEEPIQFITRQVGAKVILTFGRWSYFQGGVLRRNDEAVPRAVITDEQARRHYLGDTAPIHRGAVPASMLDERRMDSLPILRRHAVEPAQYAQAAVPTLPIAAGGRDLPG